MKLHRIYAVLLKSLYVTKRSPDRWADLFYWSAVDLVVWGLTGSYFTTLSPNSHILAIIISGILFWIIIWRGQQEISINLLEDLWNRNLINIFVSPFTFGEWVVSFLLISFVKSGISFVIASGIAVLLYGVSVLTYGMYVLPFIVVLLLTAWAVGFLITGTILRFGQKIQNLAWSVVSILSPFSAIYYPLSILPKWAQYVAKIFPTSYIFQELHNVIQTGHADWGNIGLSWVMSIVYFLLALWFLRNSFHSLLKKGLMNV